MIATRDSLGRKKTTQLKDRSSTLNQDWKNDAACRGMDTNLFFPDEDNPTDYRKFAIARKVCAACPVSSQCLDYAITLNIEIGMFGGMSRKQRRIYARENKMRFGQQN